MRTCVGTRLQDFPSKHFVGACIERLGVFLSHNNILMRRHHDPGTLRILYGAGSFQRLRHGGCKGVSDTAKFEGTCRSTGTVRLCCGIEKPPGALVPFCQFFILLFSCSHAVCQIFRNNFRGKSRREITLDKSRFSGMTIPVLFIAQPG